MGFGRSWTAGAGRGPREGNLDAFRGFSRPCSAHDEMNAIITDMCARVFPVTVAATDSDAAIREIAYQHRDILGHCGMPSSCTSEHFLDDLRGMEPQWQENIRIQTWWATLGPWESDDRMARARDEHRTHNPF